MRYVINPLFQNASTVSLLSVRSRSDFVKGHNLRLSHEPSASELIAAIGDPKAHSEIVFCGYGEPLIRLDVVKEVAAWVTSR